MIIQLPVPIWMAKMLQSMTKMSDSPVDAASETLGIVRMIKVFGWESKMSVQLDKKREEELQWVGKSRMYDMAINNVNFILIMITMMLAFATYAVILRKPLDAATVLTTLTDMFEILQNQVRRVFFFIPDVIKGIVSLDRVNNFINNENSKDIGFRSTRFSWSAEPDSRAATPSKICFRLNVEDGLLFKRGKINLIVGPTGSGKTSILMALLGEMHFIPYSPNSCFNLPREGDVAFAAQESWVLNDTIKNDIVFSATFDEIRTESDLAPVLGAIGGVIFQCGPTRDLSPFDAGDSTEVLSALDLHTSKRILEKCFLGDLVKGRTLIMVTSWYRWDKTNVFLLRVHFLKSSHNDKLRRAVSDNQKEVEKADQEVDSNDPDEVKGASDGKLIIEEETGVGHLSWASMKVGGRWPTLFWIAFWSATFFESTVEFFQPWFLGQWATQYEDHPLAEELPFGIRLPSALNVVGFYNSLNRPRSRYSELCSDTPYALDRQCLGYHAEMAGQNSHISCHNEIYTEYFIDRIPDTLSTVFAITVLIIVRFIAILILTPIFGLMGLAVLLLGLIVGHLYIKAQLSVKCPLVTLNGAVSIRAYGDQTKFKLNAMKKIDNYTRAALINWDLNRWIAMRVDALGNLFSSCLAAYFVYGTEKVSAANSGVELSLAVFFGSSVDYFFIIITNSIERLHQYMVIDQEEKPTADGVPPAYWPSSGSLLVENLSARYSSAGPRAFHDISFKIQTGERVGIVGRIGSGKSSLTLSLLCLITTEGNAYYDGRLTSAINLDALRPQIKSIPQIPELLSGTLRQNLDPALASAVFFSLQAEDEESRMNLDSTISRGGGNLSAGQRQIITLAKAMVWESMLLILDEATSAIDYKTDAIIQGSLRHELKQDVAVVQFDSPKQLLKNPSGFHRSLVDESGDKDALYAAAGPSS
ncbi:hypothetical protein M422DRAFT_239116 [Sphaerobolus stellatus SS14]|nr:hypothetical protein M422DRAFT_239116 [Sphaerobolus stellatus SS14]